MKGQQFRFRIVALLLIALLGLAGFSILRIMPLANDSVSLRDAILQFTGRVSPTPASEPSPTVSPGAEAFTPSPAQEETIGADSFVTSASPGEAEPGKPSSEETPPPPFSEALSQFFSEKPPEAEPDNASVTAPLP